MKLALSEVDQESGTYSFDAVRGIQAGREFYTIMCTFATVCNNFPHDDNLQISPKLKAQRKLKQSRIPKIAKYILDNPESYILSSIIISVNSRIKFNPTPGSGENGKLGKIIFPIDADILINDGQHRCAAIRLAYEQNRSLKNEKVSVVVFEDKGLKNSQQMFTDLNEHAVKPTKSLSLLYNHRDTFARFIVNLVDDVDVFYGMTEMENTNISNRSTNFVTLNGVSDATLSLLRLTTKSISSEKQKLAVEYWDRVSKNIPEWNLLVQKKVSPSELRKNYVHAHTNILNALGMVGYILTTRFPTTWQEKLKKLQKINWGKDSPVWEGKIVIDGKMIKNKIGIKKAAVEILKLCGVDARMSDLR